MPTAPSFAEHLVFHRDEVFERFEHDHELLQEVFTEFINDAPHRCARMHSHFQNGAIEPLHKEIHSLKGVAANLSGHRLVAGCRNVEAELKAGQMPGDLGLIENVLVQFLAALKAELTTMTTTADHEHKTL